MRYVVAFVGGAFVFLGTALLLGFLAGRMFDGLTPPMSYAPVLAVGLIALVAGASSFRATLNRRRPKP